MITPSQFPPISHLTIQHSHFCSCPTPSSTLESLPDVKASISGSYETNLNHMIVAVIRHRYFDAEPINLTSMIHNFLHLKITHLKVTLLIKMATIWALFWRTTQMPTIGILLTYTSLKCVSLFITHH